MSNPPVPSATDQYAIDKTWLKRSFSRAASTYDAAAVLQAEVRERMFERLQYVKLAPQSIIDAGCGTGHASHALLKKYPNSQVLSLDLAMGMLQQTQAGAGFAAQLLNMLGMRRHRLLAGDIERLPIASNSVQLIWSNLAVQWCNDLDAAFVEAHRVLQAGGLYSFSTFGPDTLKELRVATSVDAEHVHVSRFIDMHDIGDALVRAGFNAPVLDVERFTLTYDDVLRLMRDLKAIGAHNAAAGRRRGLAGKSFLRQLAQNYEQFRNDGKLPATYEVVYAHAWKPEAKPALAGGYAPIEFRKR